jgi:hypothetical protein
MSNRVSKAVLLCEDQGHERLVIAFLKQCGVHSPGRILIRRVASRLRAGGNVGWVMDEFPKELRAFRQRQTRAETLLIVVIDADDVSIDDRRRELNDRATRAGLAACFPDEIALIVPKRHVETWIQALLGEQVTEESNCKSGKPPSDQSIHSAARRLHEWSLPNARPGSNCVVLLSAALPTWRMICSRLK